MPKKQPADDQAAIQQMMQDIRAALANPPTGQEIKQQAPAEESIKQTKKRLYECEDCKTRRFVPWVELNRAAKPRCMACGSTRLELVNEDAKDDRARLQQQRITGTSGSLRLASGLDTPHKKVT